MRDRMRLVTQGVRARAAARAGASTLSRARHLDVDEIVPPDTAICAAADALCAEASPEYLHNHCLRSYVWAHLLHDGGALDNEAFFVAMMLHDLGLTEVFRPEPGTCFTLPAADRAHELALEHGWDDRRAELVADAIALHINVIVADRHGPEAKLVRAGSVADVAGIGMQRIDPSDKERVVARHPRRDMTRRIDAALREEAERSPCCRTGFLYDRLGFGEIILGSRAFAE